jgi:lipoate-protein ligase A
MRFMRLIIQEGGSAPFNMALDEAISEAVRKGLSPPTLRLYQWESPSITIGYFQRASDIDMHYCSERGYAIVRRLTGGRAILHDDEITYSISSRFDGNIFTGRLHSDYSVIGNAILCALSLCGIDAILNHSKRQRGQRSTACFKSVSYGEITVDGRKITGNAQKRFTDGLLQQGSIPLSIDRLELKRIFNEGFDDVAGLRDIKPGITVREIRDALRRGFEEVLGVRMISDRPTDLEMRRARELESERYSTRGWNMRR